MNTAIENDIRKLHVVGTAGVNGRLGRHGIVLAAPRTYRVRGELITLPHVPGVASRLLWSTATVRPEHVASAA